MKLAIAIALAVLTIIIILQNTVPVETNILFMTITMPRALLLLGTLLTGFAIGVIVVFTWGRK